MTHQTSSSSDSQPSGLTEVLKDLHGEALDSASLNRLAKRIHAEALQIARQRHRRRGSPDGVTGASDLANSAAGNLVAHDPRSELENVLTTDDLRKLLHRKLRNRWIDRRRRALAEKRGGGKVRQASQIAQDGDSESDILIEHERDIIKLTPPTTAEEVTADVADFLGLFEPDSNERRIVELLLMSAGELTQAEIGERIGLSRDAVGRRIRTVIRPTLERAGFTQKHEGTKGGDQE